MPWACWMEYHPPQPHRQGDGQAFRGHHRGDRAIVDGPISAEVIGLEAPGMIEEGRRLSKIHKNVVVKVPRMPRA